MYSKDKITTVSQRILNKERVKTFLPQIPSNPLLSVNFLRKCLLPSVTVQFETSMFRLSEQ